MFRRCCFVVSVKEHVCRTHVTGDWSEARSPLHLFYLLQRRAPVDCSGASLPPHLFTPASCKRIQGSRACSRIMLNIALRSCPLPLSSQLRAKDEHQQGSETEPEHPLHPPPLLSAPQGEFGYPALAYSKTVSSTLRKAARESTAYKEPRHALVDTGELSMPAMSHMYRARASTTTGGCVVVVDM